MFPEIQFSNTSKSLPLFFVQTNLIFQERWFSLGKRRTSFLCRGDMRYLFQSWRLLLMNAHGIAQLKYCDNLRQRIGLVLQELRGSRCFLDQ